MAFCLVLGVGGVANAGVFVFEALLGAVAFEVG